ncbi:uncharacterized protein LOC100901734 [Galendromus occidentalis]|uniref:Uncharacterized protein LOC100901734 n=1 Tax=Galendromus occidentalis TaxID=34638 RepID=A0AAJ6QUF6_9ACAR|nr:uncharacterized protein LOC100901734 [Galendromus occidentalis]
MTFKVVSSFLCVLFVVSAARGQSDDFRDDPLEQSRDCFEKVHFDFSRRITDGAQRELGLIMGDISDAEEKRVNPKEKGAVLKHFSLVLKRTEYVAMENKSFSPEDKVQIKAFIKHLKNCIYGSA